MACRAALAVLVGALLPLFCAAGTAKTVACDIVVAGGSTASLAAAITAAEAAPELTTCFTEITDWPGGQMTAGGVPAIDFGGWNQKLENQPASFRDFFNHLDGNPGACSVSIKCYDPSQLVKTWIMPRLAKSKNLKVFLNTAVVNTTRDASGKVVSITAVQRTPVSGYTPYTENLSKVLPDWYSTADSARFTKTVLTLTGKVFIEATEFGDVLATSGLNYLQGVEVPNELSWALDSTCGQAWTLTYYMTLLEKPPAKPQPVPAGSDEGIPFPTPWALDDWLHTWTWRRSHCAGNTSLYAANVGDITQQNLINDLDSAYLFLPLEDAKRQVPWASGVNLTALAMLEGRAYGSYHYMLNTTPPELGPIRDRLALDYTTSGSAHGLSKMPYLRDGRRAIGVDNFRLTYAPFDYANATEPRIGYHFDDSIALGNYNDDVHHLKPDTCYPAYMSNHTTKPYYVPFRALMVGNASNLLVAGKTLSETFHANGATRLHPSEWTTGVAAAGAAVLMVRHDWTSSDAFTNVNEVRAFLNSSAVGQPLVWTPPNELPPLQTGYTCALSRCIGITTHPSDLYPTDTCNNTCTALADDEWLANMMFWTRTATNQIRAVSSTLLKKSTAQSSVLPADKLLAVPMDALCTLVDNDVYEGYMACRYTTSS